MSNQCKPCMLEGNIKLCEEQDCTIHDSWYVKRLKEQLNISSLPDLNAIEILVKAAAILLEDADYNADDLSKLYTARRKASDWLLKVKKEK